MKMIFVILLLVVLSGCAPIAVNAEPESSTVYMPVVEDDLPALPLDDFITNVGCWPVEFNRCEVEITRDFFQTLKGIPSPIAYEGELHRKIGYYPPAYPGYLEDLIWEECGQGLWVVTDDWRQGTIHYRVERCIS